MSGKEHDFGLPAEEEFTYLKGSIEYENRLGGGLLRTHYDLFFEPRTYVTSGRITADIHWKAYDDVS
jgi:hypothetical protein